MSLYVYLRAARAFVVKHPMPFAVGGIILLVFALGMACGCSGGVKFRPGIVTEKTVDGPDGTSVERKFSGAELIEVRGGTPIDEVGGALKSVKKDANDAKNQVLTLGYAALGVVVLGGLAVFLRRKA